MKKLLVVSVALLAGKMSLAAPAPLAPANVAAKPAEVDARAIALIDKSIAAYGEFKSFSQPFVISTTVKGKKRADIVGTYSLARPNLARAQYEITGVRSKLAVSDGKNLIVQADAKKFIQEDSRGNPTREVIFGMPSAMAAFFIDLVNGTSDMITEFSSVKFSTSPNSETITAQSEQFTYSLTFDSATHLLSSMSVQGEAAGAKLAETTTFGTPTINVDPATLAFVLPAGATLEQAEADPNFYDSRLVVGAAPFPLSGKALDGKALSLDSMKGKVVLLDFWATWCGPCIAVLPDLKANYDKYHAQGFEVVGISLDDDEAALRSFIKEKAMPWPQIFDGKGWEADDAKAYGVQAIPFTLLIGKDGKIVSVNPGAGELPEAIEKALAQ